MAPRRRAARNRDLPDNLYSTRRPDGRIYFQYRHPVTGRCHGMGYDRAEAVAAARELNAYLGRGQPLVRRIAGGRSPVTLGEYIGHYRDQVLPRRRVKGKPLSPQYLAETRRILARIDEALGAWRMDAIGQGQLAAYLHGIESADAHNQHRVRLIQLWRHAISDELVAENLPERILPRDPSERIRRRLALEAYLEIREAARPAIANAMDLALTALQRRIDVQKWRFDDQVDGYARVIQSKTRKHGPSAWLRIPLELPVAAPTAGARTLGELIRRCRDDVPCPFLVHERPGKIRKSREKQHPFQLARRAISQGFADAREATRLFHRLSPAERPTFHEILSLGQHLREQQGWTQQQIQTLRGHTSGRMTAHYQEGHDWTTVELPGG